CYRNTTVCYVLIEAIVVTGITTAALVGQGKVMRAGSVVGGQAPQVVTVTCTIPLLVLLGPIAAGVQRQGIAAAQRTNIVQVDVLTLEEIFHIRGIQRCTDIVIELIAAAQYINGLQTTAVPTGITFPSPGMEATGMYGQAVDFIGGEHGAGKGFRQQTAVVMAQNRQRRTLVTIAQHGLGETSLGRGTTVGGIALYCTGVINHAEVDPAITGATSAAVQSQSVLTEGINTEANNALSEAGVEVQDNALTPLGAVVTTIVVVTIHISIAQEQISTAVLDKALG